MNRRIALIAMLVLVLSACDSGVDGPDGSEATHELLDAELTAAITKDGQRRLENFFLPDGTDLSAIPQDPRNPLTRARVELGKLLFHETALARGALHASGRGTYSCATCHHADAGFQGGRQQVIGDGGSGWGTRGEARQPAPEYPLEDVDVQPLRSPSVLNTAYQKVMLWSGAAGANGINAGTEASWSRDNGSASNYLGYDGLESQAITALSTHRMDDVAGSIVASNPTYRALWNEAFSGAPVSDERAGLAIAAYERTVFADRAPFQRWLRGDGRAMSLQEKRGAILFFGAGECGNCHAGPALSSTAFYALGMPDMQGPSVLRGPFSTRGRGDFIPGADNDFTYKVPQLYNLADSPFYGHGGTFRSLRDVVRYYSDGIPALNLPPGTITRQFRPLRLSAEEIDDLTAFLTTALRDPDLDRYVPDAVPSGNCIPANDPEARRDLGCEDP